VLTVTALTDGEYLLSSVALGIDEDYAGVGEAPGVWGGGWSRELGLEGMVEADDLRSLIDGNRPVTGAPLLSGRARSVKAFDLTFSAPKSVSLLWAMGSEPVADTVMAAHRDAVAAALGFLENHAATARLQMDGVRRHVPTQGWVVAGFVHRTSREGDPQLHTHCLVPNVVRRQADGRCVALAARPLFVWARAAGSIYQAELQRGLSLRLGVGWGPDRSNTREVDGFTRLQLRAFSKRTVEIEAELEARGAVYESPVLRMRADDEASLATRPHKDRSLTPSLLIDRWHGEAATVGLVVGVELDRAVCGRSTPTPGLVFEAIVRALVDEQTGLCAHAPRFGEHDVVEHVAALSAGRLSVADIVRVSARFLGSDQVARLVPARSVSGWEPARWSTAAHRALEDDTLGLLDVLQGRPAAPIPTVASGLSGASDLGPDQCQAVGVLCGEGGAVRVVLAPAGYGKTAMVHAAARAAGADGRLVVAVSTTAKAVAELAGAGLPASTIARLRLELERRPLPPGTVVVVDEVSQTSTRDAHTVLAAVAACPGGQLWVLGDVRQAPAVKAGGFATELERRSDAGDIPAATLTVNRRQVDRVDRHALGLLRAGDPVGSQRIRASHGWEHQTDNPEHTRRAMADAVTADLLGHGLDATVALTSSHGQAEELADRIRRRLGDVGVLTGPAVCGPGWTTDRHYRAGDRMLLHTRHGDRHSPLVNGTVATVTVVHADGVMVRADGGQPVRLALGFVQGTRADGTPNLSHAWARTVDGAQGGTWDHVHLLGTPALDAYRGYTGQSRSRHPTHTWNTTPVAAVDIGGRPADRRDPAEQVAAALARLPDTAMAAVDDPWPLHRHLGEVIAAHQAVLDSQPADVTVELADAGRALKAARAHLAAAEAAVAAAHHRLDDFSSLGAITRSGRARRRHAETELAECRSAVVDAAGAVGRGDAVVGRLRDDQDTHDRFVHTHGWRHDAIAAAFARLDQHWTDVAVACVDADQALAYGVEPLRHTHRHLQHQLADLDATIPADRSDEQHAARRSVAEAVRQRRGLERGLVAAREHHSQLAAQRWPRRDSAAIGYAADHIDGTADWLDDAHGVEHDARAALDRLDRHQHDRRRALTETAPQRQQLHRDLDAVDTALDRTRPDRVLDLAARPTDLHVLGPVPVDWVGRAVWCDAAHQLEAHLDHHPATGVAWDRLCRDLQATPTYCRIAAVHFDLDGPALNPDAWRRTAELVATLAQPAAARPQICVELPGRDLGLGLEL
jgi:conjugative relaxase-like TrwC/TraI family protein